MSDVTSLNEQEKVFLAGAIKTLLLAGGTPTQAELDDLDRLVDGLGFTDYEEHLERFEAVVTADDDFEYLARNIFHQPAKTLITRVLWDLALQKGVPTPGEEEVIRSIRRWWKE